MAEATRNPHLLASPPFGLLRHLQCVEEYLGYGRVRAAFEVTGDRFLPGVCLIAGCLLFLG
jgi:hypothetical protein